MAEVFYDRDADLKVLEGRQVAVIGYGNQGRAQALNLRDSGISVLVGGLADSSQETARRDGLPVMGVAEAVAKADVIMLLIPDEVQGEVYQQHIEQRLKPGATLSFASGYNLRFGIIVPPKNVDVILMAPRTIGVTVREAFVGGSGVPADVAVWQDHSGKALATALALAKGTGCTRAGALKTSIEEETELDLFSEQAVWPALLDTMLTAYEVLTEKGFSREAVALELYASGEAADIFHAMAEQGLFEQLKFHSPTAQYGVLTRRPGAAGQGLRQRMEKALEYIQNGSFEREWSADAQAGYPRFQRAREQAFQHPLNEADQSIRQAFHRRKVEA